MPCHYKLPSYTAPSYLLLLLLARQPHRTLFGITPFPYDFTLEAVQRVHETIVPNSTIYPLHLDNGIPWKEALSDAPFPARFQRDWDEKAARIPKTLPVYLAIAPLDTDRKSLAPATGAENRVLMPPELNGAELDDPKIEKAYLNYVLRAIKQFRPTYLNIGIEAGEIMSRDFTRWSRFERLFDSVRPQIKKLYPKIKVGISFGLGELRSGKEASAAKSLIANSDYVGLSFYPYASAFDEKFGAPPYRGQTPWREPLTWIRKYTNKPIAICETGFTSQDINIPLYGLKMEGSPRQQAEYVRDLFATAKRDNYLFVAWFLAIDYDSLYNKLPKGSEAMLLWRNDGFFDAALHPKPAWQAWRKGIAQYR